MWGEGLAQISLLINGCMDVGRASGWIAAAY